MAYSLSIPFYLFRLRFQTGVSFLSPMNDMQTLFVQQPMDQVIQRYGGRFQSAVLQKGNFKALLEQIRKGTFIRDTLTVSFPEAKDRISYPPFELEFDLFTNFSNELYWGALPGLGIEGIDTDMEQLRERLTEAVRLEFANKRRLQAVQGIVSAIWLDTEELLHKELKLEFPTPTELNSPQNKLKTQWLPKLANRLEGNLSEAFGRKDRLNEMATILKNPFLNNLLLIGPSGVGKTALVWEIARRRAKIGLQSHIWETTASALLKELTQQTGWEDNITHLCRELKEQQAILFVRNLMELFEVGKYIGNDVSIAEYLLPFINRGDITLISECTEEEKSQIELRSPNYLAAFQLIRLEEPRDKELRSIIRKKVHTIASDRKVDIDAEAIEEVINLNHRYTPYSGMPGKPIRFLESLIINKGNKPGLEAEPNRIDKKTVIHHFCQETGMPASMIDLSIPFSPQEVRTFFTQNIFGQEQAVDSIIRMLITVKTALNPSGKPIASFLFAGPTGVGKTELAKILATYMFGSRDRMIRFDMSEYGSPLDVLRLTGLNYQSDGLLTSAVRRDPFCVLLFDEIEKAHPDFNDLLLQILGEGRLTDSRGQVVNFCSSIIIMTSNIGSGDLPSKKIGWNAHAQPGEIEQHFVSAVEKHFRPELFNRIDRVIPFQPLGPEMMRQVVDREIKLFQEREGIRFRKILLKMEEEVYELLARKGYNPDYGARQLQRTIRKMLVIPLAEQLNAYDFSDQLIVRIQTEQDQLAFSIENDPLATELFMEELDKINLADHAAHLRRSIDRLQQGHYCARMLSELDILEREQKRNNQKFWKQQAKVKTYTKWLELQKQMQALKSEIDAYEIQISLACMGAEAYKPAIEKKLDDWHARFRSLKLKLYEQVHTTANSCYFQLFGPNPQRALSFYHKLFLHLDIEVAEAKTLWFRESFYNEEIFAKDSKSGKAKKRKRMDYVKQDLDMSSLKKGLKPPKTGDQLFGIRWKLNGAAVYLQLKGENGGQKWQGFEPGDQRFVVKVETKNPTHNPHIHRQDFYKDTPIRRIVKPNYLKDRRYKVERELRFEEQVKLLKKHLDRMLMKKVDEALI